MYDVSNMGPYYTDRLSLSLSKKKKYIHLPKIVIFQDEMNFDKSVYLRRQEEKPCRWLSNIAAGSKEIGSRRLNGR